MAELSVIKAQSILGCGLGCRHFGGSSNGCEYYRDEKIVRYVGLLLASKKEIITCIDSTNEYQTSKEEAIDIINQ